MFGLNIFIISQYSYDNKKIDCNFKKASKNMCTTDMVTGYYDSCPDQAGATVSLVVYIFYHLIFNLLLLNILIAIFK